MLVLPYQVARCGNMVNDAAKSKKSIVTVSCKKKVKTREIPLKVNSTIVMKSTKVILSPACVSFPFVYVEYTWAILKKRKEAEVEKW